MRETSLRVSYVREYLEVCGELRAYCCVKLSMSLEKNSSVNPRVNPVVQGLEKEMSLSSEN